MCQRGNCMNNVLSLVGNTPLLELEKNILAKAEHFNPTGSIKDRMVKFILEKALEQGKIRKGMKVVEATTGNTGISLAFMAKQFGLKAVVFMSKNASEERKKMIKMLGAELILEKTSNKAEETATEYASKKGTYCLKQYKSKLNPLAHYNGTGREIIEQCEKIDTFITGIGTGGTLAGVSKRIKEKHPKAKIIGVIPNKKNHQIEGLKTEHSEKILPSNTVNKIVQVSEKKAVKSARALIKEKGILAGISSGANYYAAKKHGEKNTITILPDSWNRYYSTKLFEKN